VITRVFPLPAAAMISSGPSTWVTGLTLCVGQSSSNASVEEGNAIAPCEELLRTIAMNPGSEIV